MITLFDWITPDLIEFYILCIFFVESSVIKSFEEFKF